MDRPLSRHHPFLARCVAEAANDDRSIDVEGRFVQDPRLLPEGRAVLRRVRVEDAVRSCTQQAGQPLRLPTTPAPDAPANAPPALDDPCPSPSQNNSSPTATGRSASPRLQYTAPADQVEAAFDERLAARSTELTELTDTRRRLERKGDKLLAPHFADAIDLDTLKRHQDRIRAGMTDIDRRIADEYEQNQGPRKQLKKALRLLIGCASMYAATDNHGKRLANQTFTNGIDITADEQATPRLAGPYETTKSNPVRSSTTSEIVELRVWS